MSAQDDRKDELLKTPPAGEARTTPLGSSDPHATIDLPQGMDFTEARLAGVSARYELEAELGRGGMGIVYRARDKETSERVALKVLKPEIAGEQALVDRFKNELRLARKITHKHVCRTYELLRFGETVVIAMEYVEGESLRAVLERFGGLPLRKGIAVAQQVCSALGEAHAQGIVHRDLKPENLMLDRAGNAKVMDFGIARSVETSATTTGGVIGTPAYMAPEQAEGKPVDARTDIYSLGLILYEMFTGAAAFRADTPLALAMKQIRETPPAPRAVEPTLPAHIEKAILKCLEKNPAKRFQSVEELEGALTREVEVAVTPEVVAGEETPLPLHLMRWERSDWGLLTAGALAVLLSVFLYDRVLPFGALEVRFSQDDAVKRARELMAKYAPDAAQAKFGGIYMGVDRLEEFPWGVVGRGLAPSLEHLQDAKLTAWSVRGSLGERDIGSVELDRSGRVNGLDLTGRIDGLKLPEMDAQASPAPVQEVLPLARQYAQELFGAPVANLAPTPYVYNPAQRRWVADLGGGRESVLLSSIGTPVEWVFADQKQTVLVVVFQGKLVRVSQGPMRGTGGAWWQVPNAEWIVGRWQATAFRAIPLVGVMSWLGVILFFARRLYRQRFRLAWVPSLLCFFAAAAFVYASTRAELARTPLLWLAQLAGLAVAGLFWYCVFSIPEYYAAKVFSTHLRTLSDLLFKRLKAQAAGLAVLRGGLLGACYVGLHLAVLLLLGKMQWGAASAILYPPSEIRLEIETGPGLVFYVLLSLAASSIAAWLLVVQPLALLRRVTARTPLLLLAVAVLWMAGAFALPGALTFPVLPLYFFAVLQGVGFAWIFLRYDLLTCFSAMLTVSAWLFCFPLFRIFGGVEFWSYIWVMAPWALFTLMGAVLWFRPELIAWRRRTVAVFE